MTIQTDNSQPVRSIDVFYTHDGKANETASDHDDVINRFWRHSAPNRRGDVWKAKLPLRSVDKPLWVYANVRYELNEPVSGAGYYYRIYLASQFNVSSLLQKVTPEQLKSAGAKSSSDRLLMIEPFNQGWQKEWFSYTPDTWPRATHKVGDDQWRAPDQASLALQVRCSEPNQLVVMIDGFAAVVDLQQPGQWQDIVLNASDFRNLIDESIPGFDNIRELKLSDAERLNPARGDTTKSRMVGKAWRGSDPEFQNLRWVTTQ
ncbi:MAG: hypothetical protein HKN47_21845 [Pirellulaceae bacterium]|nr:hypothetical protein [Pirellulaceae bacterium]